MKSSVVVAVALAGAIGDDRPGGRRQRDVGVLVALTGDGRRSAFLRVSLVADIGPQLVAFDPVDAKADHHAVVQFGAAAPDA